MTTSKGHPWPLLKRWREAFVTGDVADVHGADLITRWLIITRASVFSMTFTSGLIGLLLAAVIVEGGINWLFGILSVLGIVIAHAANNIMNDLTDYTKGIDTENYPRTQYGIHPLLGKLTSKRKLVIAIFLFNLIDLLIMIYLTMQRGPLVIAFAVSGLVLSLLYTGWLKKFGLGELTALIVWGPLMIGGTAFVAAPELTNAEFWQVVLASLPYGLIVASVLVGKHTDKIEADRNVGVRSVPVLLGEKKSLTLNKILFIIFYITVALLVTVKVVGWGVVVVLFAIPRLIQTWKTYSEPRPEEAPEGWPVWPLWYVGWAMYFNRKAGELFILGLIINLGIKFFL